jgi:uncharacterized protein YjbI with pentapeptide repeats/DNA-binding XRE family transcriptional regulator
METNSIGERITDARKRMAISQAQLAEHLFISPQAVGKWERGESLPDIVTLQRLAELFGVEISYFLESSDSASTETANEDGLLPSKAATRMSGKSKIPNRDMSRWSWTDADFSGLKNLHEKFASSNLQRCLFIGSELSGLLLKNNRVADCDFSGSDLSASRITGCHMANNQLTNASLRGVEIKGSYITACDFSGADFSGAAFKTGGFAKNELTGALWNRSVFKGSQLADIVFDGRMVDCSFENCSFSGVTFRKVTLINTFFKNRSLKRIRFEDCEADRMTYAFLKSGKARLEGIRLLE